MENVIFDKNSSASKLIYQMQSSDKIDSMTIGMLTNNKIPGLAPAVFSQFDSQVNIRYDIDSKISVRQFFEGQISRDQLLGVFYGIVNAVSSAENYMLDINSLVFDLDYIFTDESTYETVMICLPVFSNESCDYLSFFKNIMYNTQFDQKENCDYVARIINYLNGVASFSFDAFRDVLDDISSAVSYSANHVDNISSVWSNSGKPVQTPSKQDNLQENPLPQSPAVAPAEVQPQPYKAQPDTDQQPQPVMRKRVQPQASYVSFETPAKSENVPPAKPAAYTPLDEPAADDDDGEKISFMYLMQHYNKDNAAKYKAQKAAKKAKKEGKASQASEEKSVPKKPSAGKPKSKKSPVGFPVPGQATPSYPVPGQASAGYPVPGKFSPTNVTPAPSASSEQPKQSQQATPPSFEPVYIPEWSPQENAADFGETVGIILEEPVPVQSAAPKPSPHLIRTKTNEDVIINKPIFKIGKKRNEVDYYVSDNRAVSRRHAEIITRGDSYFIVDTDSTNHTFINGTMIPVGTETELKHGDKICLGNEDFEFYLD